MQIIRRKRARNIQEKERRWPVGLVCWHSKHWLIFVSPLPDIYRVPLVGSRRCLLLQKLRTEISWFLSFFRSTPNKVADRGPRAHVLDQTNWTFFDFGAQNTAKIYQGQGCQRRLPRSKVGVPTEHSLVSCAQRWPQVCPTSMGLVIVFIKSPSVFPDFLCLTLQHSQ